MGGHFIHAAGNLLLVGPYKILAGSSPTFMEYVLYRQFWKKKTVPPSLKNWIKTLEGFLDLYKILVEGGKCKFFLPRALNQDVIENYFGKVRNQRSRAVNPTAIQFRETFKSLMIRNFCGTKSIGTNCEKTNIPDLFNIRGLVDKMNSNDYQNSELSYEIFNVNKYISNLSALELEKKTTSKYYRLRIRMDY
jgi:hypothetical protein